MSENGQRGGKWQLRTEERGIHPLCLKTEYANTCYLSTPPMQVGNVSSQN